MAIKPILFNTEMVRAILDGRKTCTRRVAKNVPDHTHRIEPVYENGRFQFDCFYSSYVAALDADADFCMPCFPPYQRGDILYVRETWCKGSWGTEKERYYYKADDNDFHCVWHPSIHMPKEAARIWLKVKDVRVERLQECGEGWCIDIEKEGIVTPQDPILYISDDAFHDALRMEFQKIWDSTIKKSDLDRYGWNANPWVWVIEFERCEKPEEE
nr:MAG TPA: ASCH domain protein [Caudoviricetes sp.]